MLGDLFGKILTFIFAFSLGAGCAASQPTVDPELQTKVQEHMDVIVDESAAIVDDVLDEARKDERVQKTEEFVNDVEEIVDNTVNDIYEHFGPEEETEDLLEEPAEEETQETPAEELIVEETEVSAAE